MTSEGAKALRKCRQTMPRTQAATYAVTRLAGATLGVLAMLAGAGCCNLGGGTQVCWAPSASIAKDTNASELAATRAQSRSQAAAARQGMDADRVTFDRRSDTTLADEQATATGREQAGTLDASGTKTSERTLDISPLSDGLPGVGAAALDAVTPDATPETPTP